MAMLNDKFDIQLNEQQQAAAFHVDGPAIVLAVPGAGKTTTMVVRIHNLIKVSGINPQNILTMTFSRASARDMQARYVRLFGEYEAKGLVFSTIHSFALSVIRNFERKTGKRYCIIEGNMDTAIKVNKKIVLKNLYRQVNNSYITEDEMEQLTNELGLVKNKRFDKNDFKVYRFETKNFNEIYSQYEHFKKENDYIDFDDMLTFAYEILLKNNDMKNYYQNQYKYVLVDEGQDTSLIQHELIKLLVMPKNNIFMVADDDQSIYGFRGADPTELNNFSKNYSGTKKYLIETNYRSTQNIVKAANAFIKLNSEREPKNMRTGNKPKEPIEFKVCLSEDEQLEYLRNTIKQQNSNGDTAILYRNNMSAILLIDELDRSGFEFSLKESKVNFFKHWVVLDILSFINFSLDNSDIASFEKIFYKMEAYLPKVILDTLKHKYSTGDNVFDSINRYCSLTADQTMKLEELRRKFDILRAMDARSAIVFINYELSYNSYLIKYCRENNISENSMDEYVFILKRISINTQSIIMFLNRIEELSTIIGQSVYKKNTSVILSTIHGVKGLEFDNVIIVDLIEGKLPSGESIKRYDEANDMSLLNEEARLFYVGITRAKQRLTLLTCDFKTGKKASVSRYFRRLYDIEHPNEKLSGIKERDVSKRKPGTVIGKPYEISRYDENQIVNDVGSSYFTKKIYNIKPKDKITHKFFGSGEVVEIKSDVLKIQFDNGKISEFPTSSFGKYIFKEK